MLVDTDILIDYFKDIPQAVHFVEEHLDQASISAITVAELYQGVRNGAERNALDAFVSAVRVWDVSPEIGIQAGLFRRQYRPSHGVGLADCLIAATAQVHKLPLRSLNTKHFPMLDNVEAPYVKP